jgi:succinate dehydrogenase flavin-adding protein (antitoxin of CptAB toxin-antitoxin module)
LLRENDPDLLAWVCGQQPVPERHAHDVVRLLRNFRLIEPQG